VIGKGTFPFWRSFVSVVFEAGSALREIGESAFKKAELENIDIPASVVVLGESAFRLCKSLASVAFESGSAFDGIAIPASVAVTFEAGRGCSGRVEQSTALDISRPSRAIALLNGALSVAHSKSTARFTGPVIPRVPRKVKHRIGVDSNWAERDLPIPESCQVEQSASTTNASELCCRISHFGSIGKLANGIFSALIRRTRFTWIA
jgi:hypothetical protein